MKKIVALLVAVLMVTTLLAGCGGGEKKVAEEPKKEEPKKVELLVWHQYDNPKTQEVLDAKIKEFTAANPNITVKIERQDNLADLIMTSAPSGAAADVILGPNDWVGRFAAAGIFTDIEDLKGKAGDYVASAVEGVTYQGKLYGLPLSMEAITLYVNTDLVKEVPKTTDDLLKFAKENTKGGKYGFVYPVKDAYFAMPWIYGFGGYSISKDGKPGLNDPSTIKAAEFIKELNKYMPKDVDYNVMISLFNEGKVGIMMNGPWAVGNVDSKIKWSLATIPVISATNKPAMPYVGIQAAMLNGFTKVKPEALKFVEFIAGPEVGKALATGPKLVPANKAALNDAAVQADPVIKGFGDQAALGTPMPNIPEMSQIWGPQADALTEIVTGVASPKDAFEKGQKKAEEGIANLKK